MEEKLVKIAISGKGVVRQINRAHLVALAYFNAGYNITDINANPDAILAMAIGTTPRVSERTTLLLSHRI